MWISSFLISGSLTMVMPFLSLLIDSMGDYSTEFVLKWAGLVFGVTFVTAFIISPVWGRLGDRHGRKKLLLFLSFGASICILLMGIVTSVYHIFIIRFFMGFFAGFIPMAQAFIATQTPKKIAGKVMGTLQTGSVSGGLFGPLIGGWLADSFGFTYTFLLTGFIILFTFLMILAGVKEVEVNKNDSKKEDYSSKQVFYFIFTSPLLLAVMVVGMLVQIANFSIQPLLAIYVGELHGQQNLAFFSGAAFSVVGLGNLLLSREWGKLGDRFGHDKILLILVLVGAVVYVPQAFVTSIWQLLVLRLFLGMVIGGVIPCIVAYIRQAAPFSIQGEVLGYNTSFRFFGNVVGPIMGGFISGYIGISSVFFVTSGLFIIGGFLLWMVRSKSNLPKMKNSFGN
ncbi:MFS transporter [Schinkia azotoformans]|uniref:MFS transporter n=1 Tax=Schinkia azotoformans TaxID=1454 RepID=UPI002DB81D5E|nr:MFS transporter [Schinkia azotoformans]MEC1742058.1 MFS transporter [Schinkia azotoformans]MEC1766300.1 MFS transporter [Schinkia azotoformans]MEC1772937.1 MFS transporter [Schinkia azotoformans]MEC1786520.1 MFS transporter [Schinkia azotoformans]MED4369067.1 MFS transporter [Schinkia azotoformans]